MMVVTDVRAGGQQASGFSPLTPAGASMIRVAYKQRSLVGVVVPDRDKPWDPVLRRIDAELEDEGLLEVMLEALARRRPLSQRRGRPGTPATVPSGCSCSSTSSTGASMSASARSGRTSS